jgi:hypothetical protein
MSRPQVDDRLAIDGDGHRRADLGAPREVLGNRLPHALEAWIASAVHCSADHKSSSYAAAVAFTSAASSRPHATARPRSPSASGPPVVWTKKLCIPITG